MDNNKPLKGHSYWGQSKKFPVKDWQYEVANGDTRHGYWDWVRNCIATAMHDKAVSRKGKQV